VGFDDGFGNGQAKAVATSRAGARFVGAIKRSKMCGKSSAEIPIPVSVMMTSALPF
jgi:hypothetical protein